MGGDGGAGIPGGRRRRRDSSHPAAVAGPTSASLERRRPEPGTLPAGGPAGERGVLQPRELGWPGTLAAQRAPGDVRGVRPAGGGSAACGERALAQP